MIFFFFICLAKHCACCVGNKPAVNITIRGLIGRVVDFIIYPGSFIYCIYIYIYFSGQNFDIMHNRRQRKNTDGYAELPQKGTFLDTQTQTEIRKQIYIYIYSNTDSDWYSTLYDTDAESAEFGTEEETVSGTYRYNDTEMGTRNSEYSE